MIFLMECNYYDSYLKTNYLTQLVFHFVSAKQLTLFSNYNKYSNSRKATLYVAITHFSVQKGSKTVKVNKNA